MGTLEELIASLGIKIPDILIDVPEDEITLDETPDYVRARVAVGRPLATDDGYLTVVVSRDAVAKMQKVLDASDT